VMRFVSCEGLLKKISVRAESVGSAGRLHCISEET